MLVLISSLIGISMILIYVFINGEPQTKLLSNCVSYVNEFLMGTRDVTPNVLSTCSAINRIYKLGNNDLREINLIL